MSFSNVFSDISSFAWLCFVVLIAAVILIFRWFIRRSTSVLKPQLPKLPRRDFTLEELQEFDGSGLDGRILLAVNGKVFDVTNNGQHFYGKGAPYAALAGNDSSRALARFKVDVAASGCGYDDLSDLSQAEMDRLKEWELQFLERYDFVGRLLRPGEPHRVYDSVDDPLPEVEVPLASLKKVS